MLPPLMVAALFSIPLSFLYAADAPDLQLTDEESTKVGGVATDTEGDGAAPSATPAIHGETRPARPAPSREFFEALLRKHYVGTHSFYRRLSERSREEVFLDFSSGASIEALRAKIIDRFLHP